MFRHRQHSRVPASIVLTALVLLCMTVGAHGQDSAIIKGVNYIVGAQDPSGLWNVGGQTEFRDASAALRILSKLGGDSAAIADGSAALEMQLVASSDYMARQLLALAASGTGIDLEGVQNSLIGNQRLDGGWGYGRHYGKNVLETALAMRALMEALSDSTSSVGAGVSGLLSQQNPDGGFGFAQGDSSRVYYSAQAALALKLVEDLFSVSTQLQDAVNWLIAQANPDGGFGTGGVSNPYETGLALAAIAQVNPLSSAVGNAMTYLMSSQMPDGSWGGDVYSTAIAIEGLFNVGPDIAVPNAFINFTPAAPIDSDQVTISATIRNDGVTAVNNVVVQFFDGHPDSGGVQIGTDHTITTIAGGSQSVVQQSWDTFGLAGDHSIYVVADPFDVIVEPLEFNNSSSRSVHVSFPPDLYIDPAGIVFDPPAPGVEDQLTITTTIRNLGEVDAVNVDIEWWVDHPDSGGASFFSTIVGLVPAGGQFDVELNMGHNFNQIDWYYIWTCADRSNSIREFNEDNNCQFNLLVVGPQVSSKQVSLCQGLNLLGMPVEIHDPQNQQLTSTSFALLPFIPACTELDYWERSGQRWMEAVLLGDGGIAGEDQFITTTDGFFARVSAAGSLTLIGVTPPVHQCTDLEQGLNIIGVPDQAACYTAFSLLLDLPDGQEAHRWDCTTQQWVSASQPSPGVFVGDDFAVDQGAGYFVKVGAAAQWCIGTCDTLPTDIPDLLVTPSDIFFNPNPAPANTSVFLALNVNNIGADTAFSPNIAFFDGDPDFGGTILAFGPLPVDIPPGGQSGFFGFTHSFATPGSFEIYGVADHSDLLTELDETNNSTFATLTITAAATAAPDDTRKGLPSSLVTIATNKSSEGPVQFRYLPDITPAPLVLDNRGSRENTSPAMSKPGSHRSLAAAATISQIAASNQSSASATITWVTQEVVNGCVRYGIAPGALDDTICSLDPDGYVHVVQITGLAPSATYFYEVVSDSTVDNNGGAAYQLSTTAVGAGIPYVVYGAVFEPDSLTPAFGALVVATLTSGGTASHPISVLSSVTGTWSLNLGNLKDPLTGNPLAYQPGDSITIAVEAGPDGSGFDTALVAGISPQDADTVVLTGGSCCVGIRGDVNFDGLAEADIVDLSFLVDFLWQGGPDPVCLDEANLDGSGDDVVDIVDLTYLVDFLWQGGPPPPSCP